MQDKLPQMIQEAETLSRQIDNLLEEPTQDNLLKAQEASQQFKQLSAQIQTFQNLEKEAEEARAFLQQPRPTLPFASDSPQVFGFSPSGTTYIEQGRTRDQVVHEGAGLVDDSVWKATAEPGYRRAFANYLRKGEKGMSRIELKALQEGADSQGGFLVPEDFARKLIERQPTPTRIQDRVTRLTTGRDAIVIPRVNYSADDLYTTGIRATFTGEVPITSTAARVTEPTFGEARIPIFTAMMSMPLTNNMVEDSAFPIQDWCEQKFSETLRLLKENMILNGTGLGQPSGILSNPGGTGQPQVVNMGNPITADGVVKMAWSLPEQYEDNLAWVMNKTSAGAYLATLKDANNRYLWGSGLQDSGLAEGATESRGTARKLQGYPVLFQGFMPNLAANANPIIFGDLGGYFLVERVGFSIQVLRELYAETNQVMLLGRVRFGGQVCEEFRLRIGQQA